MKKETLSYDAAGKVHCYKLSGGQLKRKALNIWFSL